MKSVICFIFIHITLCLCQDDKSEWASPEENKCINELSLDKDHIVKVLMDYSPGKLPEDDDEFSKFTLCRGIQTGTQNENGEINFETLTNIVKSFSEAIFNKDATKGSLVGSELSNEAVTNCKSVANGDNAGQNMNKLQNFIDEYLINHFNSQ